MKNYKDYVCYILDIKRETLDNVLNSSKYHRFEVPKRSGGVRVISAPDDRLKWVQEKLNNYIISKYDFLECQCGFVKGKSIVYNARVHVGAKYVLNIDLKDFFPSINFGRVRGVFMSNPFYLDKTVATILANIACYMNQLPQGAPSSPVISNVVCYSLDKQMLALGKTYGFNYTRYADDITISTNKILDKNIAIRTNDNYVVLGSKLRDIIEKNGFTVNEKKTKYSINNERKEVTGLIVNEKVNIKKVYLKELRALLNRCKKDGMYEAAKFYYRLSYSNCNLVKELSNVIDGKLNFIAMVRGKDDLVYQKYLHEYIEVLYKEGMY